MLALFLPVFLIFLMIGLPVVFALLLAPGLLLSLNGQERDIALLYRNVYNGMDSFPLMALPFFVLAAVLAAVLQAGGRPGAMAVVEVEIAALEGRGVRQETLRDLQDHRQPCDQLVRGRGSQTPLDLRDPTRRDARLVGDELRSPAMQLPGSTQARLLDHRHSRGRGALVVGRRAARSACAITPSLRHFVTTAVGDETRADP